MNRMRRRRTFITRNTTSKRSRRSSRNLTKFPPPPEAKEASWFSPGRLFFFATPSGSTAWCSSTPDRGYLDFGPAQLGEGIEEVRERQADDVEIAGFHARDVTAGAALDAISSCFVMGFAGREIAGDFFGRERGEMHLRGFHKSAPDRIRKAYESDPGDHRVGAAAKPFEHMAG